jgi:ubiquinone/menaquinone biosynthesis methyltransferase
VAGGTGDVAFASLEAGGPQTDVTVLDINAEMLAVGRDRAEKRFPGDDRLRFVQGNAEELGLPDNHFDAYTIAFGIRNVPRIDKALAEAFRVLKRGGRFLCLEFSHVDVPLLDKVYEAYSFNVIPPMGRMVTGEAEPYQYLVESIRKFPKPQAFAGNDRGCRLPAGKVHADDRRGRGAAFRLEAVTHAWIASPVMVGLVPTIHVLRRGNEGVGARDKPEHDVAVHARMISSVFTSPAPPASASCWRARARLRWSSPPYCRLWRAG